MKETFGQTTSQLGALRAILDAYPFSVGALREQIQNADDAGASKQIFLNDRRTHPSEAIYHPNLASTQGPAFLAFNNAQFLQRDWDALQHAYESSKSDDSTKIGKYGVGFRSVFHVTDCPQILSGKFLAMFDPLQNYTGSSGFKKDLQFISSRYRDQLAPFQWFQHFFQDDSFSGTVIRCPLRATGSKIRLKTVHPNDIAKLFRDFINEELGISLLFLRNIKHLEIHDVDEQGVSTCLATLSISRSETTAHKNGSKTHTAIVTTTIGSIVQDKHWSILHYPFDKDHAIQLLSQGLPYDPTSILKEHKLLPDIGLAIPLNPTPAERTSGRLFTYLPLPLPTGFCIHVHALFALTQSRQHLRNTREIGVVDGSSHQILTGWNRLLFDYFIPQAWNRLLDVLANNTGTTDIFKAWPPEQRSPATSGESIYWEFLPKNLLKSIMSSKSAIWPVYQRQPSDTEYRALDELIAAEPNISKDVLGALTSMGLRLTCPPTYICRLIKDAADKRFAILTPETAHAALLKRLDSLRAASKEDVSAILQYLLSTQKLVYIIGLPIISTVAGELVALSMKKDALTTHTLLTRLEHDVFGSCDDAAIGLQSLPYHVAETLRTQGPNDLNVETLGIPRIIEYLTLYPNRMGLDLYLNKTDARVIKWLSVFWMWMKDYTHRNELLGKVKGLYLLPSSRGLRKAEVALFRARGEHPNYVAGLSALDLPFLDADLTTAAQDVLASFGLLRSISNIHEVLNTLPVSSFSGLGDPKPLSRDTCVSVLRHISTHAYRSRILHGAFTKEQIQRLKNLPIYPMASFPPGNNPALVVEYTAVPDGVILKSIANPPFLPAVSNVAFIQISSVAPAILEYLDPSSGSPLSDVDILDLTVSSFATQPEHVHAAVLTYIVRNRHKIPPYILEAVQNAEFVVAKDGVRRRPGNFIDPDSKLASLYDHSAEHQIKVETDAERSVLQSLQTLQFMQHTLSAALAQELINLISADPLSQKSVNLARSFWSLVTIERLDCSSLKIAPDQRCLPTDHGLRGPAECRDPTRTSPHLFDRVLAVLEPLNVPSTLRQVLGWNQTLPTTVLIKQLDAILDTQDIFQTVLDIVRHLSKRHDYSDDDFESLKKVTADRKWVPTTDQHLAETRNAVFQAPVMESGFHQVMSIDPKMKDFLRLLGCSDKPSYEAIVLKLNKLRELPASLNTVNTALALLRSLPSELDDAQRDRLLLPDEAGSLQSFSAVHFNDIGEHARLVPLQNSFIAHPLLDDALAKRLGVGRLGLEYNDIAVPGLDMGEKPVTTVRKTISEYTEKQFATEFLANAADANATEFALMVNKFHPGSQDELRALSPTMATFCTSDSLVVYNNSTFSEADLMGILRTSIGGKREKHNTIGQFGLGALTMFHFTEMAILVSDDSVLFLNPSKEHLPITGRASLLLPLNRVRQYYPSHLASIDGLFGFSISSREPYNKTLFVLPLRNASHVEGCSDVISHKEWSASEVENEILGHFSLSASNCLLFTQITKISSYMRDSHGNELVPWSFTSSRSLVQTEADTGYSITDLSIADNVGSMCTWRTAHAKVPEEHIPQEILKPLHAHHRPRLPSAVGLAAMLGNASVRTSPLFFSTLPLDIPTSLPIHVMASFLLSSDRRHIRLDQKKTPESDFNEWLLTHVIPPLYLCLLQNLLQFDDNKPWWPGQLHGPDDRYSRLVIEAFYSTYLMTSSRPIFRNMFNPTISLTPQNVVLSREEPSSVHSILSVLQSHRVTRLSSGPSRLAKETSQIAVVNPAFLKSEILGGDVSVISEFDSDTVEDIITYLLDQGKDATNLMGLPILPLEDGSFGTLQPRSASETYFAWTPRKRDLQHNFPPRRFVHPKLKLKDLLKLDLNVVQLQAEAIKQFVEEKLPSSYSFEAPSDIADWIGDFWLSWDEYSHLGLTTKDILQFPMVPTVRSGTFVSLASCKDSLSVVIDGASQQAEFITAFLDDLDVQVVRLHEIHLPAALIHILRTESEYPRFNILTALEALKPHQASIAEAINFMDIDLKSGFAEWARGSIHDVVPDELRPVAQELPLWPSASNTLPLDIRPALAVRMLPQDISIGIVSRFMNVCVADYGSLRFLRGPSLTLVQLMERLVLPPSLLVPDLIPYKELLGTLIPLLPSIYVDPVPIPDCSSLVKPSNELYARDRLFVAAFGEDSTFFIHPDFQTLEKGLYKHGLMTENELNVQMFLDCVRALNESEREQDDLVVRANVLFESYGYWLPMQITAQEQHRWSELDDCSFIPRSMATHRHLEDQDITLPGLEIPQNVVALDAVVAPSDLVREEFEAIAWTQRAAFANQPHQRVVVAYPDLGRPTISEVVTHLRYLSSLTNLSASQRRTVLHDLEATYNFLNYNVPSAELILSQLGAMEIFLNVDDPETDEWRWDKADELVFDSQDIDESMRHVRDFLIPFGRLLRATGVEQVSHAHFRSNSWNSIAAPESKLASIRLGFEDLRKKKLLADVIFKPSDHTEDSEPLVAHRSFLAVSSEYFSDLFCGDFKEGEPASDASPISIALPHHSKACARLVLDHIYTGAEPEAQTLTLDLLLEALKLSGFWDIKDLFKLLQKEIADNLVTPRTLNQIRTKATECHAEELIETCVDYEQRNAGLIQKYASRHARPPELELE